MKRFSHLRVLAMLLVAVCAARAAWAGPRGRVQETVGVVAAAEPVRVLRYAVDLAGVAGMAGVAGTAGVAAGPACVRVELTLGMPASGVETLVVPTRWADATGLEAAISEVRVEESRARLEAVGMGAKGPTSYRLRAPAGSVVHVRYVLRQDWTGPRVEGVRHRVLLGPNLAEWTGENGLLAPAMAADGRVEVRFGFVGLPAGRTLVTSFGSGTVQRVDGRWSAVRNALFAVGVLRTRVLPMEGGPVLLAISEEGEGEWRFGDAEVAEKVGAVLGAERRFWRAGETPWFLVVVSPMVGVGGGGTAFTHGFALSLGAKEGFGAETESLLAHEAFHEWNPQALGPVVDGAAVAWFVEGFTTFYQDRLLERAGLIDRATYLARLNRLLRDERSNRALQVAVQVGSSALDAAARQARAPYLRGAAIAFWLNGEMVEQAAARGEERSLDDFMRALLVDPDEALTNERLLRTAGEFVDGATVDRLRLLLANGAEVPLPGAETVGPCVLFAERAVWSFDLGMSPAELRAGATLSTVREDSNAWRAGVRNGARVQGWSMWPGDPDHEVQVSLEMPDGRAERLHFWPRGGVVQVPEVSVAPVFHDLSCQADAGGAATEGRPAQ